MDILKLIAFICHITSTDSAKLTDKAQLECQKYYVKCLKPDERFHTYKTISKCIEDRKL